MEAIFVPLIAVAIVFYIVWRRYKFLKGKTGCGLSPGGMCNGCDHQACMTNYYNKEEQDQWDRNHELQVFK